MRKSPNLRHIAFVGGYEPRRCGIATFTHDLCEAIYESASVPCSVVAVNDRPEGYKYPSRVCYELQEKDLDSYRRAADFLNYQNMDMLSVQHEFGIYGGVAGSHLLALLKEVRMPVVTTLHTILQNPSPPQRKVMDELVQRSDRLVVMANKGAEILNEVYGVHLTKIDVIPHGIPDIPFTDSGLWKRQFGVQDHHVLLTFGLLGPGKGIEHVIAALPEIVKRHPQVVYLVLGATHPHLIAKEGERYRLSLERLAEELGVRGNVIFYNRFVTLEDLTEFIKATDIYVTPYLNEEQITSGTLAYVFGAGKAVVSTPYWHATELLAEGRGLLTPFCDPAGIARAVCQYLDSPAEMERTRKAAYQWGREMIWPAVAQRYWHSFQHACSDWKRTSRPSYADWIRSSRAYELPALRLDHLDHMTDGTGLFQHAVFSVPDFHHGYCTDDNARALILCTLLMEEHGSTSGQKLEALASRYLAFLTAALNRDTGRFRNFMSHGRQWLEEAGSEDSHGRALWALGTGAAKASNKSKAQLCAYLFEEGLHAVESFTSPRAWAFTMLGLDEYLRFAPWDQKAREVQRRLVFRLVKLWLESASDDWLWFEPSVTYDNARLCQSLLVSSAVMPHKEGLEVGLMSLRWLASLQRTQANHFRPIGSNGFYVKGGARADFDQQPVEAQAMVSACLEAFRLTGDKTWRDEAKRAFEWFLGRNDLGISLYDAATGGCRDGLHRDRANENQGAESTLAFHIARAEMSAAEHPLAQPLPAT
nr:glycosyltransferase family 4 protein [Prosthecobacter debontii]